MTLQRDFMSSLPTLKKFIKYTSVAGGAAACDWLVFSIFYYIGADPLKAQGVSRVAGGVFSFIANKHWSFKKGTTGKLSIQARRFLLLYAFSYSYSLLVLYILIDIMNIQVFLSKLLVDVSAYIINFNVMNIYVFDERKGITRGISALFRS